MILTWYGLLPLTSMMSPSFLPIKAAPRGESLEILPWNGSDSTEPTIVYVPFLPSSRYSTSTVEPKPIFLESPFFSTISSEFAKMFSISVIRPSTSACLALAAS